MNRIRFLALTLIAALIAAAVPTPANAGEADEVLVGFVFGTSFGLVFSSILLIVYTNPEADVNVDTVMIIGGLTGAAGGVIFGSLLPDDAVEQDPVISLAPDGGKPLVEVAAPRLGFALIPDARRASPGVFGDLLRISF